MARNGAYAKLDVDNASPATRRGRSVQWQCVARASGVVLTLLFVVGILLSYLGDSQPAVVLQPRGDEEVFLVIAVGSAPQHFTHRQLHRLNFENYRNSSGNERVITAFFTDRTRQTEKESNAYGDILFNPGETGYQGFAERGEHHLRWALNTYKFDYYLRLDDDGVLCLERLVYQLKAVHRQPPQSSMLFWGKYHCLPHQSRADENFMLFSRALAEYVNNVLAHTKVSGWTFALNVGAILIQMKDVTIIDDREQIDSQQEYITEYMRKPFYSGWMEEYRQFCFDHVWAHHTTPDVMRASIVGREYGIGDKTIPRFYHPSETCGKYYSYNLKSFFVKAGVVM